MRILTRALSAVHVWTGLIAEQQSAVLRAGVDARHGRSTLPVPPVVGEGERPPERARHCIGVLAKHGVEQRIPGYQAAKCCQRLPSVTER